METNVDITSRLELRRISKKFNKNILFKELSLTVNIGESAAITGRNGSGKSTLLKIIVGLIPPQKGDIMLYANNSLIDSAIYYKHINICAPYLEVIEDFTLQEHLDFHEKFKKVIKKDFLERHLELSGLLPHLHKSIKDFSSGMKQRLKLILSLCFEGSVILLDEPSSHLDKSGKEWYKSLVKSRINDSIILFFSNDEEEYISFAKKIVIIEP